MRNPAKVAEQCRKMFANPDDYLVFDTETTGLDNNAQVIQVAAVNLRGETLFNQRVKPTVDISAGAQKVHGIDMSDLLNEKTWRHIAIPWEEAIAGKTMIAYNAPFDVRLLDQTYASIHATRPKFRGLCAMDLCTKYYGERRKLQGGDHTAVGDCIATIQMLRGFAIHNSEVGTVETDPQLDAILNLLNVAMPPF
jgi:DNA polymerase III subunit epsilon